MRVSLLVQKMQSPHSLACAISGKGTAKFDKLDLCFVYAILKLHALPWQESFHMWIKAIMAAEKHLLTHSVQYLKLNKCFIHFEDVSQSL